MCSINRLTASVVQWCWPHVRWMMGSITVPVKTNTMKLVFVDSQQSTQLQEVRTKTGWLEVTIMCPSGVTCPSIGCWFGELAIYIHIHKCTNNSVCWSSTKQISSHQEVTFYRHDVTVTVKKISHYVKQNSLTELMNWKSTESMEFNTKCRAIFPNTKCTYLVNMYVTSWKKEYNNHNHHRKHITNET